MEHSLCTPTFTSLVLQPTERWPSWPVHELMPMDKTCLAAALQLNRIAAIVHQPFAYLSYQKYIPLHSLVSLCEVRRTFVSVIVDASQMPHDVMRSRFTEKIQEFFSQGAAAVLLPATENVKGPPSTSVLMEELISNIPTLQS